jgi:hypothetical protein
MLRIDDFPQLNVIAWNRPGNRMISEQDAFALYERNWRFVDTAALDASEKALIKRLNKQFGFGVVLHV